MRQQYAKAPKGSDNSAPFVLAAVFGIVACVAAALFIATDSGVCLAPKNAVGSMNEPCKRVELDDKDGYDNENSHEHIKRHITWLKIMRV